MQKPLVRRQIPVTVSATPTASGVSGGETVSSDVNPGSSLLLGASGVSTNSVSGLLTGSTSTSSPTPSTSSSPSLKNSPPSVSTGSVLAIAVTVFLVLIGAMFLIHTYIKRRISSRARHPLSRGPQPVVRGPEILRDHGKDKRRNNSDDRSEGKNNSLGSLNPTGARGRSPDSAKFGLFEKDPSIHSLTDEKANISTSDDHHFDPSTMASFARYTVDGFAALSQPHPLASHAGGSPPVSWDGRTVISDPFASLHASVSDTMSPTAVVVRQTPLMDSAQHRWESAEVVMMDEARTEPMSVYSDMSQSPFNDDAAPRTSSGSKESARTSNGNPFFNASQHSPFAERSTRSRASSVSNATAKRSRSYSASSSGTVRAAAAAAAGGPESENALVSLLAALRPSGSTPVVSDEQNNRNSMRTTLTSLYTPAESGADPGTPQAF